MRTNKDIAAHLRLIADYYFLDYLKRHNAGSQQRGFSFAKTAEAVEKQRREIAAMATGSSLAQLEGVGASTSQVISEYLASGMSTRLADLARANAVTQEVLVALQLDDLAALPGMTAPFALCLNMQFGVTTPDTLRSKLEALRTYNVKVYERCALALSPPPVQS